MSKQTHRLIARALIALAAQGTTMGELEQQIVLALDGVRSDERLFWRGAIEASINLLSKDPQWNMTVKVLQAILDTEAKEKRQHEEVTNV